MALAFHRGGLPAVKELLLAAARVVIRQGQTVVSESVGKISARLLPPAMATEMATVEADEERVKGRGERRALQLPSGGRPIVYSYGQR